MVDQANERRITLERRLTNQSERIPSTDSVMCEIYPTKRMANLLRRLAFYTAFHDLLLLTKQGYSKYVVGSTRTARDNRLFELEDSMPRKIEPCDLHSSRQLRSTGRQPKISQNVAAYVAE